VCVCVCVCVWTIGTHQHATERDEERPQSTRKTRATKSIRPFPLHLVEVRNNNRKTRRHLRMVSGGVTTWAFAQPAR
jgi:hypothetical protein